MTRALSLLCAITLVAIAALGSAGPATAQNPIVQFDTVMGSFNVELFPVDTPITVANFLHYVVDGDYDGTIIHRSEPGLVIQGGGYTTDGSHIPTDPPIPDEVQLSNVRGTIAMAKTASPNSATSEWFFNLVDNLFLDTDFTVFGQVVGSGMDVVDAIAALPTEDFGPPFQRLPVRNYDGPPLTPDELVIVNSITVIPEPSSVLLSSIAAVVLAFRRSRRRTVSRGAA